MTQASPVVRAHPRRGRRRIVAIVALAVVALLAVRRLGWPESALTPSPGPNVLVIVLDTTRGDRCSFAGYDRETTPHLAAFARDAVVYRNAYVPGSWTGPTHASLFTGLRPESHGFLWGNRLYLTADALTLAEVLGPAGWSTAAWSGNMVVSPDLGFAQGFARFEMVIEPAKPSGKEARRAHRLALDHMRNAKARGTPFMVFVNHIQPHAPYRPPEPFLGRFVSPDVPPAIVEYETRYDAGRQYRYLIDESQIPPDRMKVRSDLYDAEIASLDDAVGELLDGMREAGLLDDTIVVVTSDHGEHFGERQRVEHSFSLYRPILHVPLLVRVPGRLTGGRVVDDLVRLEDVFPTILDACGRPVPPGLDGESLLALDSARPRAARAISGRHPPERYRRLAPDVPFERFAVELRSVIEGRWHLIRNENGTEELFDVEADPLESVDLAAAHPEVRDRLRALLPVRRRTLEPAGSGPELGATSR